MTSVVDARDVDHAIEQIAATFVCDGIAGGWCTAKDPCARCVVLGLLRQARRFEAFEPPWAVAR